MKKLIVIVIIFCITSNALVFGQKKIDSISLYTTKAIELRKADKLNEAIAELKNVINIGTTKAPDFNNKAKSLMLLCNYNRAARELNKTKINDEIEISKLALKNATAAIKLNPKVGDFYFTRAKIKYEYLNQTDSALNDLGKSILLDKSNIDLYKYRLSIYKLAPNFPCDKATYDYTQLIKLDTVNSRNNYENRAECFMKINKQDSAILDYTFLINKYQDFKYNEQRGDAYVKIKKYQSGINDYTIIIKNRMTKRDIRIKRANAYYDNNSLDTAFYEYTNIKMEFDMASMNKEIAMVINKIYGTKLTQLDIDKSDKFLDIAKNDILWPYQLKTADDTKYYNQIKEALSNSIKADPYQYNAYLWMAEMEYTVANYEAAKQNYLAAHKIMPLNPEFLFRANKSEAAKTK